MICRIEIEGCDKTGKDTLVPYLDFMSGRTIPISTRGLLSTLVYNNLYNRDMTDKQINSLINGNHQTLIVLLTANQQDLEIRFKTSGETPIDIKSNTKLFQSYSLILEGKGINVLRFDTSKMTPFQIATEVMTFVDLENNKEMEEY